MKQHKTEGPKQQRMSEVLQYIDEHLEESLSIEKVARLVGLSPFHFARLFRMATGRSPHRYVVDRRIRRARDLLIHSRSTIPDIAYQVGFASQSHMTTVFRKRVGVTPRGFRRPHAEGHRDLRRQLERPTEEAARV